jgi:hypothetical protein
MSQLGYTARNILLFMTITIGAFLILQLLVINQPVLATLILIGLLIPITILALQYSRSYTKFQCNNCQQTFTVTQLKLIFTVKFGGTDPPTGTVAYDLKCPNCNTRDWLIPTE